MNVLNIIEVIAALAGLALAALVCVFPRFGRPASWTLVLFLLPASLASAILGVGPLLGWPISQMVFFSCASLLLIGSGGFLASYALEREDYLQQLRTHRWFFLTIYGAAPVFVMLVYWLLPVSEVASESLDLLVLGPAGYGAAVYLLLVSIIGLANVEQTLRGAEEHVRWEIKFVLLGLAAALGALVYVASQVLLYSPQHAFLPLQAVNIFPVIFLLSCALIFQSWKRSSVRTRVAVSQGVVYSTITFFSVGVYLIGSSLIARWASQWTDPGVRIEAIIFLFSGILLAALLLGTAFRHRVRFWVRRNVFAGTYDYRQFWMDATGKVRSIDPPSVAGAALAELIYDALGSLEISVWLRVRNSQSMRRIAVRGSIAGSLPFVAPGLTGAVMDLNEPAAVAELGDDSIGKWPPDFFQQSKASLVVPLISSGRLVGLLTVGADRSGRTFDREAREFLRVLSVHAANEFHKSELLESLVETREAEAFRTFSTFLLHDLKNFASTLSLIAKNAVRYRENPDFQLDAFRSIHDTAEKMKHLCNGLRSFSTSLAANKKLDDLNHIVREVAGGFDPVVSTRLKLDLASVPSIPVDRQEFARVLQNLVLNATEASPDETIELSTRADSKSVVVCVADRGKGIPADFLEKGLFQPFHTTKVDGLGIGLFQSKKIVEAHDGTIEVESREGEGTLVRIILPLSAASAGLPREDCAFDPYSKELIT